MFALEIALKKNGCVYRQCLRLKPEPQDCLGTTLLPLLLLCDHGNEPFRCLALLSKQIICYRFHPRRCRHHQDSTWVRKFIGSELYIYQPGLLLDPRWQRFHLWTRWRVSHCSNLDCLLFHSVLQSNWLFSFLRYRRVWFVLVCFRLLFCVHRKRIRSRYNHWFVLFNRVLWFLRSSLTKGRLRILERRLFDFYRTNRAD